MDLTNDDVAEILALLDSLPYDELDLQTPRFRLTLRRTPGGWTEESQNLADPTPVTPAPNGSSASHPSPGSPASRPKSDISEMSPGQAGDRGAAGDARSAGDRGAAGDARSAGDRGAAGDARSAGDRGLAGDARSAGGAGAAGDSGADLAGLVAVAAPLPGTFYRAPRPGAAPFVDVGDAVTEETVVAIVETMKLMNSVHAGTRGRVAEICLGNAESVAQGATLMWIEPGK
jgi:biotin carboxyl carrier protein